MPPKKEETPENALARARVKRDNVLNSIKSIHATALAARADADRVPSLIIHADDLNEYVEQFQRQQDVIINALIDLNRVAEFDQDDRPMIASLESMRLEIKTVVASVVSTSASEIKSSSSSSIVSAPQQFVPLPKIQLPSFNGSLLEWRSFRDIYVSLVHDNTGIGDAERFHYLLSCLSGDALAVVKAIPLSANNYALAWEALSVRFDNKRLLASAHLDKLFAFKPITHQSFPALTSFINTFKENVAIIKALGVNDLSSFLLFHMGSRVLDPTTIQLFESNASNSTIPTFDELLNFVQQRCRILENVKILLNKILPLNRMTSLRRSLTKRLCPKNPFLPLLRLHRPSRNREVACHVIRLTTISINVRSSTKCPSTNVEMLYCRANCVSRA